MAFFPRWGTASAAVAALLVGLALAPPAGAQLARTEHHAIPAGGSVTLAGHGYGHGLGLSQWGARGAATQGVGYRSILDFYYPRTTTGSQANSALRIRITGDTDNQLRVVATPGMVVYAGTSTPKPIAFSAQPTLLRIDRTTSGGFQLRGMVNNAWQLWNATPVPGYMRLASPSTGLIRLVLADGQREYRGSIEAVPNGSGVAQATVAVTAMEDYLKSVVPAESPSSWPIESLKAQAVAARTYAAKDRSTYPTRPWHTCDSTSCQVYPGYRSYSLAGTVTSVNEAPSTNTAVSTTAGEVRVYGGALALTQFSASNGGWTAAGSLPYQVAKADPWDGIGDSSAHRWSTRLSAQTIAAKAPTIGTPKRITVTSRTGSGEWGGRVISATVTGTTGAVNYSGTSFRSTFGLKSDWWKVTGGTSLNSDFDGNGLPDFMSRNSDGSLSLHRGNGAGAVGSSVRLGTGWHHHRLVLAGGDFTGDGRNDVLAVTPAGQLLRYPSNGSGGWQGSAVVVGNGWQVMRIIAAASDATGDGRTDLYAVDFSGKLWLYTGNGAGSFTARTQIGSGWEMYSDVVGAGDWDGDGIPDLLAKSFDGRLLLYSGTGGGKVKAGRVIGTGWNGLRAFTAVEDWGNDGRPDIIALAGDNTLKHYPWTGTSWAPARNIGSGWATPQELL